MSAVFGLVGGVLVPYALAFVAGTYCAVCIYRRHIEQLTALKVRWANGSAT
ncbi:hypothetical protein BKA01_000986 [Pseudonocardia eucalypti]|nr:hypothetical protein [Pseudonocardia eucalypti]